MRLLIAVPVYDTMRAEFVQSLTALMERLHKDGVPYEVKIITGTLIYTVSCAGALSAGTTHTYRPSFLP